jgi:hypothetical protein
MVATTATDARRIGGVPISLKWLSFCVLNADRPALNFRALLIRSAP